jgi:hypothetical protein
VPLDAATNAKLGGNLTVGVADGVGGWNNVGVDPSAMSRTLMQQCENVTKEQWNTPHNDDGASVSPHEVLSDAYEVGFITLAIIPCVCYHTKTDYIYSFLRIVQVR